MKKLLYLLLIFIPFISEAQIVRGYGMVQPSGGPTINSSISFTLFSTPPGTPSAPQSGSFSANSLTANVGAGSSDTVMELSTNGSTYTSTLTYVQSGGTVTGNLFARVKGATSSGSYSGNITLSSSGASTVSIPYSVTVTAVPFLTVSTNTITGLNSTTGTAGTPQTFIVTFGNIPGSVGVSNFSPIELSTDNVTYTSSLSFSTGSPKTVYVRNSSGASPGAVSGTIHVTGPSVTGQDITVTGTVSSGGSDVTVGQIFFTATTATVSGWTNAAGNPDVTNVTVTDANFANPATVTAVHTVWFPVSGGHSSSNTGGPTSAGGVGNPFPSGIYAGYWYNEVQNFTSFTAAQANLTVSGLTPGALYTFKTANARATASHSMTEYFVDSTNQRIQSQSFDAANNNATWVTQLNLVANSSGQILIGIYPQTGNGTSGNPFGYINAIIIIKQSGRE